MWCSIVRAAWPGGKAARGHRPARAGRAPPRPPRPSSRITAQASDWSVTAAPLRRDAGPSTMAWSGPVQTMRVSPPVHRFGRGKGRAGRFLERGRHRRALPGEGRDRGDGLGQDLGQRHRPRRERQEPRAGRFRHEPSHEAALPRGRRPRVGHLAERLDLAQVVDHPHPLAVPRPPALEEPERQRRAERGRVAHRGDVALVVLARGRSPGRKRCAPAVICLTSPAGRRPTSCSRSSPSQTRPRGHRPCRCSPSSPTPSAPSRCRRRWCGRGSRHG
jgi:hypothetical protein